MYDIDILNIGKKLRDYRKANNISIEKLGNAIGKSNTTISRYENRRNCFRHNYCVRNLQCI